MRNIFKNMALMLKNFRVKHQINKLEPTAVKLIGNQLTLYRFSSFTRLQQVLQQIQDCSFYFITYTNNSSKNWLWISEPGKVLPEFIKTAINGEVLVVGRQFFAVQHSKFIGIALKNMAEQKGPHLVTSDLQTQWQWIINKIICATVCNYNFKDEYLQELTLQLVHFSLKNFGVRPSGLTDQEVKTLLVDIQPKGDEFLYFLHHNLNILSN